MIKIHDGVAINPINIVSVIRNDDGIAFFFLNGRMHKYMCTNSAIAFTVWCEKIQRHVPLLHVSEGRAVNIDAIASMAKIAPGIAFNLIGGHTEFVTFEGEVLKDNAFNGFIAEINKLESEAA